jgi:mannose-6-phosphate isomerase-like protein (cupin superfamily)
MPFDPQPTLRGGLVGARPLRPDDFAALYAVAADPALWEQHPARNRHEEPVFREFFAEALASGGALLVSDVASGRAIGSSRYHGYSEERSEVEIGWTFLARSHWGGRYNGELKQLMLRHAFRFVRSVVLFVGPGNLRSRRACENIGAVRQPEPDPQGRVVYRITADALRARFATARLPAERSVVATDGSDVRVLLGLAGGDMAHFSLAAGETSRAVAHRTVEEIWYVVSGCGELWRKQGQREEVVALAPGTCVTLPLGTHFQFRAAPESGVAVVAVTLPPWPGDGEAVLVAGRWPPGREE